MAVRRPGPRSGGKPRPPLDEESLDRLALFYVGRYATTRAKLGSYLKRKVAERGWGGPGPVPIEAVVERLQRLGYVDDRAFASARAESLARRGYGERRVVQALRGAGIEEADAEAVREQSRENAWKAALRFAERRRLGPWARGALDRDARQKAVAAMLRAGHPLDLVRKVLGASPGDVPDPDVN